MSTEVDTEHTHRPWIESRSHSVSPAMLALAMCYSVIIRHFNQHHCPCLPRLKGSGSHPRVFLSVSFLDGPSRDVTHLPISLGQETHRRGPRPCRGARPQSKACPYKTPYGGQQPQVRRIWVKRGVLVRG